MNMKWRLRLVLRYVSLGMQHLHSSVYCVGVGLDRPLAAFRRRFGIGLVTTRFELPIAKHQVVHTRTFGDTDPVGDKICRGTPHKRLVRRRCYWSKYG